jgi:hypothetical protein
LAETALFNIRNGNTCGLCEKQLYWLHPSVYPNPSEYKKHAAISLGFGVPHRAICRECYERLKLIWEPKKEVCPSSE